MIRAFVVALIALGYILIVGTPFVIHAAITGHTDSLYSMARLGTRLVLWLGGVRLEVNGRERIPAGHAVVFMPNHQSNYDGPALFSILPPVLVLAKKEFFRVPVLGRAMLLRGFVPVDRRDRDKAIEAVEAAVKRLKAGHSFLVFPEGTRSRDGRVQLFKKGVFVMAIKAGVPIVPISISGSSKIMPKGKFRITPGTIRITFHDSIPTEGHPVEDRDRLREEVREAILRGLSSDEWPPETQAREAAAGDHVQVEPPRSP